MKKVLFICTGNTCRSPMAEYLFKKIIKDKSLPASCFSAGTCAVQNQKASDNAIKVLSQMGIDMSEFKSQLLTKQMLDSADIIAVIGKNNIELIKSLGYNVIPFEIDDPYMSDIEVYKQCKDQISKKLEEVEKLI